MRGDMQEINVRRTLSATALHAETESAEDMEINFLA
jgi:hypothetical protein